MAINNLVYIELVGQPGAGKTTTAKAIVVELEKKQHSVLHPEGGFVHDRMMIYKNLPLILLRALPNLLYTIRFFLRYAKFTRKNFALFKLFCRFFVRDQIVPHYYRDIVIAENCLHTLVALEYRRKVSVEQAMQIFFARYQSQLSAVIFFDIEYAVAKERFVAREAKKQQSDITEQINWHKGTYEQQGVMKQLLKEQSYIPVLFVDGARPVAEKVQEIMDFLQHKVFSSTVK